MATAVVKKEWKTNWLDRNTLITFLTPGKNAASWVYNLWECTTEVQNAKYTKNDQIDK